MKDAMAKRKAARTHAVELVDCGRASKVTQGVPFLVLYESGWPPMDRMMVY